MRTQKSTVLLKYLLQYAGILLVGVFLFALTGLLRPANAGELYVGGGAGWARHNDAKVATQFSGTVDETDCAWRLYGGYLFSNWFGIEAGYTDLGESTYTGTWSGVPDRGTKARNGLEVSALGIWQIGNPWAIFGTIGIFDWDVEEKEVYAGAPEPLREASGTSMLFGLGVQVDILKYLDLRVQWRRYNDVGDKAKTGESDVDMLTADLVFRFQL